ncbi:hypothetical protein CLI75_12410, partial [Porphyromonas gingivalis]|uniref:hypothetical protein n=1 Tax=Porphyromonas gingivalis TaxID=837 RepID=UPI000BE71ECA
TAYVPRVVLRAKYVPRGIPGVKPDEGWIEFQGRKMSLEQFKKAIRISMLVRSKQKQGTPICLRILGH